MSSSIVSGRISMEETLQTSDNSLHSLLSDPRAKTSIPYPTTKDIPGVTLSNLPPVKLSDFDAYVSAIAPEYERLIANKELSMDEHLRHARQDATPLSPPGRRTSYFQASHSRRTSYADSISSADGRSQPMPRAPIPRRQMSVSASPLNSVPSVYFEEDFHLENPRTFDIVSERSEVVQTGDALPKGKRLATNAILQEKLSWYMDTVEIHLIQEINMSSSSFFSVLGELQRLHSEAVNCVAKITGLRQELAQVNHGQVDVGLEVAGLRSKRAAAVKLRGAIREVKDIVVNTRRAEKCLEEGDFPAALEVLETTKSLLDDEGQVSIGKGLHDLPSMNIIRTRLSKVRSRIGQSLQNQFAELLMGDLKEGHQRIPREDTIKRLSSFTRRRDRRAEQPRVSSVNQGLAKTLRTRLASILEGVYRTGYIEPALQQYRSSISKHIKSVIKENMPSDSDADSMMSGMTGRSDSSKSAALSKSLRVMPGREFNDMILNIYVSLSESFRTLSAHQKLLLDLLSDISLKQSRKAETVNGIDTPPARSSIDVTDLIIANVEHACRQLEKVIRVRGEQNCRMEMNLFLKFFTMNTVFLAECEALSGSISTLLQTQVYEQVRRYAQHFHSDTVEQITQQIERDQWSAEKRSESTQAIANDLVFAATKDPEEYAVAGQFDSTHRPTQLSEQKNFNHIFIEDSKFICTASSIMLLHNVKDYEILIQSLPQAHETPLKLLEYLRIFNSRMCQVVLGAGATRSAGLKSIAARHLAVALQSLMMVVTLIPYLREYTRRHANAALLIEFDKVKRAYQEHENEIKAKLVSIMSDRLNAYSKTVQLYTSGEVDWKTGTGAGKTHQFMEVLVKETTTMHNVLVRYLPGEMVQSLMEQIFLMQTNRVATQFDTPGIDKGAKEALLVDLEYYADRTASLQGIGSIGRDMYRRLSETNRQQEKVEEPQHRDDVGKSIEEPKDEPKADVEENHA